MELRNRETEFDSIYAAQHGRVFHWALRYAGGRQAWAEDLTHDVFLRLFERLERLSERENLTGWLYRVTANMALNKLRSERSAMARVRRHFSEQERDGLERRVEMRQAAQRALETLNTLPPLEKVVISMKLLDGKQQNEIAEILGLSKGYVSKLVARGWERIRAAGWEMDDD